MIYHQCFMMLKLFQIIKPYSHEQYKRLKKQNSLKVRSIVKYISVYNEK